MKKIALSSILFAVLMSGCAVRPHANVGLDLNYYNGSFHLQPTAHVGLTGVPK